VVAAGGRAHGAARLPGAVRRREDELNIRTHCPTHRGVLADAAIARPAVVRGGHHDVLNDLQHRSVAAEIVAFLQAPRDGLTPAISVETSAW
jgi:hypothetical protein